MVRISVVVSTYTPERLEGVLSCIHSLRRQTLSPYEIILVLDPSRELVEFYKSRVGSDVKIVVSDDRGLSNARNSGVKHAGGEIVAFIDDDAAADESWLERLLVHYSDPDVVGVGGFIKAMWNGKRPNWFPEELDWIVGCSYKGLPEEVSTVRNPIGCNMSFRKEVFDKAGHFNSTVGRVGKKLMACEETEFSIRVLNGLPGSKIVYDPSAIVYHRIDFARRSLRYVVTRSFYEGVSKTLVSSAQSSSSSLATEAHYLNYLLRVAFPSRLKRIYRLENLSQTAVLLVSIFVFLLGYANGGRGHRG